MSNYLKTLELLSDLKARYPSYNLGRHIETVRAEYGDIWGLPDKELYFAFEKYQTELELDYQHIVSDEYVKKVVQDAQDLNHILDEEDGY